MVNSCNIFSKYSCTYSKIILSKGDANTFKPSGGSFVNLMEF